MLAPAIAATVAVLRRRRAFVDVHFVDGASIRLARGPEARRLLDDARAILRAGS